MSCENIVSLVDGSIEIIKKQVKVEPDADDVVVFEIKEKVSTEGNMPDHKLIGFASGTLYFDIGGR